MQVWRYGEIFRHDGMRACGTENKITFPRFPAFRTRELSFFEIQSIRNTEYNSVSVALHFVQHAICNARQTPL